MRYITDEVTEVLTPQGEWRSGIPLAPGMTHRVRKRRLRVWVSYPLDFHLMSNRLRSCW